MQYILLHFKNWQVELAKSRVILFDLEPVVDISILN